MTLILQMDSSLEEISESLYGFCRKFVAADARSLITYQNKNLLIGLNKQTTANRGGGD